MNRRPMWSSVIALGMVALLALCLCRETSEAAPADRQRPALRPTRQQAVSLTKVVFDRERRLPPSDEFPLPYYETDISIVELSATGPSIKAIYTELGTLCGGARWSPDGTRIVFYGTGYEARNPSAASRTMRASTAQPGVAPAGAGTGPARPRVSPGSSAASESRLRTQAPRASSPGMQPRAAAGAEGQSLTHATPGVFGSEAHDLNIDIWTMRADGSDVRQLTDSDVEDTGPSWSPDGKRIVWCHGFSLWIMDSDGSNAQPLLERDAQTLYSSPDWSPDGEQILFTRYRDGTSQMLLIKPDGSSLTELQQVGLRSGPMSPRWSPDGSRITYYVHEYDVTIAMWLTQRSYYSVHATDADGTNAICIAKPRHHFPTASPNSYGPSDWMPDGKTVALIQDYSDRALLRAIRRDETGPTEWLLAPDGIADWYAVDGIDVFVPQ